MKTPTCLLAGAAVLLFTTGMASAPDFADARSWRRNYERRNLTPLCYCKTRLTPPGLHGAQGFRSELGMTATRGVGC